MVSTTPLPFPTQSGPALSPAAVAARGNAHGGGAVRFGALPENAVQQFFADTAGVYVPKLPYMRSSLQFFEDTYLEGVEDAAWYFIIPGLGPVLAKAFNKLNKTGVPTEKATQAIGTPMLQLGRTLKNLPQQQAQRLVGAKAGTLVSAASVMCAAEYLVQHNKNWLTSKLFRTNNFEAVAGLEQSTNQLADGSDNPANKAQRRNVQIITALAAGLAGAAGLSKGIAHSPKAFEAAKKVMQWADFGKGFDVSKPILALGIGTGVVSYLDAARSNLERKELASRLAIVVPFLMFGKELAGNAVGAFRQGGAFAKGFDVGHVTLANGKQIAIKDLTLPDGTPFSFFKPDFNLLKTPWKKETFLNFDALKSIDTLRKDVAQLPIPEGAKRTIEQSFNGIAHNKFLVCTAIMSAWLAVLVNAKTRSRYNQLKQADKRPMVPHANLYGSRAFDQFNTAGGASAH
jgi:hypothetical protein